MTAATAAKAADALAQGESVTGGAGLGTFKRRQDPTRLSRSGSGSKQQKVRRYFRLHACFVYGYMALEIDPNCKVARIHIYRLDSLLIAPRCIGPCAVLQDAFAWLLGLSLQASASYEQALLSYNAFLVPYQAPDGQASAGSPGAGGTTLAPSLAVGLEFAAAAQGFVVERVAECYAALTDWSGLQVGLVASLTVSAFCGQSQRLQRQRLAY